MHLIITRLAQATALLGGLVLIGLIAMICASIIGREVSALAAGGALGGFGDWLRAAGVGPVTGDFELVEAGMALAVFSFLPLTQLAQGHARVDVFSTALGPRADAALAAFWQVVMALVILLLTWRLGAGMQDKLRYGETSFLLQFPLWWAYAACLAAASVACLVSLYCAALGLTGYRRA